jgi:hypothetical protein
LPPDATVPGVDHPPEVYSENLSVAFSPACSIQLAITPLLEVVSCGVMLALPVGRGVGCTETRKSDAAGAVSPDRELFVPHAAARRAAVRASAPAGIVE